MFGDYLDYYINVGQFGTYNVTYRTAAESQSGQVRLELIDAQGNASALHTVSFPSTGGWQTWTNTSATLILPEGLQQLRMQITQPLFNMNWFEFDFVSSIEEANPFVEVRVFPNPGNGWLRLEGSLEVAQDINIKVLSPLGQVIQSRILRKVSDFQTLVDIHQLPSGTYFLQIVAEDGAVYSEKILKY